MDLDYYRDFMTIARAGTIAEAARQLRIAQPALSHRLKQLEEHLNAPLIKTDRGVRKIELTEAGEYLYERAQYLISTEDNLKREVTHRVQGTAGILKVSLSPSTAMMFIRDYLVPFSRTYPQVQHRLNEVTINEQTNQLLAGESEIGVANAPLVHPDLFQILHTERERLLIASSRQSRWNASRQPIVSLEALRHTPLVRNYPVCFEHLHNAYGGAHLGAGKSRLRDRTRTGSGKFFERIILYGAGCAQSLRAKKHRHRAGSAAH